MNANHDTPNHPHPLLALPVAEVFKDDARSRVWRVEAPDGRSWVVKCFKQVGWRQRLAVRFGKHPAQREQQWHERLAIAGVPAAAIDQHGTNADGSRWLITPYLGVSLYNWLRHCDPVRDVKQRQDFTRQLGKITGEILRMRVTHGDYKASNVVIDGGGVLHLIDAGACRGAKGIPLFGMAMPMLVNLLRNVEDAATYHATPAQVKTTRTDRLRFFKAMREVWPVFPDGLQHLPRHREFG